MEDAEFSKPLHIQRLEQALKLDPFLNYVEQVINQPVRWGLGARGSGGVGGGGSSIRCSGNDL